VCGILALLFIVVPAMELYILIKVGGSIGAFNTIGIIVVTGFVGAALAKHQGFAAIRKMQQAMMEGRRIGTSLVSGALVVFAGALMLTPGFVTDSIGLLLLVPPIRAVAAGAIVKWGETRVVTTTTIPPQYRDPGGFQRDQDEDDHDPPPPGVIDV
jgi:UPF0716 protein FxsA